MKIKPEQLQQQLSKGIAPIYLIGGNEPLLVQETCDLLKQQAEQQAYPLREVITVDTQFDWPAWLMETQSLSLLSNKRYFELRLPEKLNKKISDHITQYANNPAPDTLVVFVTSKLDSRSAWVKVIEQTGVVVQIWPINKQELPRWLRQRLQQQDLNTTPEGLQLITEHVENNLLAAQQAIHKLKLVYGSGPLSLDQIADCLGNDAKYDIFQWVDTVLAGDATRAVSMLRELKAAGTEVILTLWALTKDIRQLTKLSFSVGQGLSVNQAVQQAGIWPKRRPLMQKALSRHPSSSWQDFLTQASQLDQMIKGARPGNPWDQLETLALQLCGKDVV